MHLRAHRRFSRSVSDDGETREKPTRQTTALQKRPSSRLEANDPGIPLHWLLADILLALPLLLVLELVWQFRAYGHLVGVRQMGRQLQRLHTSTAERIRFHRSNYRVRFAGGHADVRQCIHESN